MKKLNYPIYLSPYYQAYVWGGDRIAKKYRPELPEGTYAESWEVSDRQEGMGIVQNGPFSGNSLASLVEQYPKELVGYPCNRFPLLIKILDATQTLSVQVHPNDASAHQYGGEAKTEMWYVLDATPDAAIYCGLRKGTNPNTLKQAIQKNQLEPLLNRYPVKTGEVIYVPGGQVHAIAQGCMMLEVQQNSNTTYRIFDWGRLDTNGEPRELHIEKALKVIDWENDANPKIASTQIAPNKKRLIDTPFFTLDQHQLAKTTSYTKNHPTFEVLFLEQGQLLIEHEQEKVMLEQGSSCLLPADLTEVILQPQGACSLITILPSTR